MADKITLVTDDGREAVFDSDDPKAQAYLASGRVKVKPTAAPEAKSAPKAEESMMSKIPGVLASLLPSAGGTIGQLVGGAPGAALGGAAGEGYRQLATHAKEIPGAIADVGRNLVSQPGATLKGAAQGAMEGAAGAGLEGAEQAAFSKMGDLASKAPEGIASAIRTSAARRVAVPEAEAAFKSAIGAAAPQEAVAGLTGRYAKRIKDLALTGSPEQTAAIRQSGKLSDPVMESVNALQKVLDPAGRKFGHLWSLLTAASAPAAMLMGAGAPEAGLLPMALTGIGVANKFPGQTAAVLSKAAPAVGKGVEMAGRLSDPVMRALLSNIGVDEESEK